MRPNASFHSVTQDFPSIESNAIFVFFSKNIVEDNVLRKAQRGLLFGKPKFGIFVTCFYKEGLNVNDPTVQSGIVDAACDVIKYALELEKAEGSGEEFVVIYYVVTHIKYVHITQRFRASYTCKHRCKF